MALAGTFFWLGALTARYTGVHRWNRLGLRFELHDWETGLWYGTALWVVALSLLALAATAAPAGLVATAQSRRRWGLSGAGLGGASGLLFSFHYYYLVPHPALQFLCVLAGGACGMAIHLGFFALTARVYRRRPEWLACARSALYVLAGSGLISGPLCHWEAVGTEPIWSQLAFAAIAGAAFALALRFAVARLSRRTVAAAMVVVIATALVLGVTAGAVGQEDRPARRRVILFTLDTTRADYLSCYGYPRPTSPHLDRLAAGGVRFSRAYCNIGITDPSHASILTGTYPRTHGLIGNHLSITGQVHSLAALFLERGFTTAAIVSREHVQPSLLGVDGFMSESAPHDWIISTSAREAHRRVANFFARHPDEDIFLWVHLFDPHQPYLAHPEVWPVKTLDRRLHGGPDYLKPEETYTDRQVTDLRELYAGEIAYTDLWLGRILDRLDALPHGGASNLVVVTADHGEILGEFLHRPLHFGFGHGPVYEPGVWVPLIISQPGLVPAGRVVDDIAESVDLAPTIAELALGAGFQAQGRSLAGAVLAGAATDGRAVIEGVIKSYRPDPESALVEGNWKLVVNSRAPLELYELGSDPGETRDRLTADPTEGVLMFGRWEDWLVRTPLSKPEIRRLSDRERRHLRSLGYVDN